MELTIYDALLDKLATAVEQQRPELLGVHTSGYHDQLPFPWNANKGGDPISLDSLGADVDYDARCTTVSMTATPGFLTFTVTLDASAKLSTAKGVLEEARFSQKTQIVGTFNSAVNKKYSFAASKLLLTSLEPAGIRTLLSWILADSLTGAVAGYGVPTEIKLFKGKIALKLDKPKLITEAVQINGKVG